MYFEYLIIIVIVILVIRTIKKKYIKYSKIFKINGLDGVYFYFIDKNFKKLYLSNFIDKKKHLLEKEISKKAKNKILYGPYRGTIIGNKYGWSNIDFSSKYLGTYESQIQNEIIQLTKKNKFDFIIDLGAAEGYHIISLLKKKYFKKGLAFEINKKSREILERNAKINKVHLKLKIFGEANSLSLIKSLNNLDQKKLFFLVDIEGNEYTLFNKQFCKKFSKSTFIIEEHPFNIRNNNIIKKFKKNITKHHKLKILKDTSKDPFNIDILESYSDDEKYLMMSEGRPQAMKWLILQPKK